MLYYMFNKPRGYMTAKSDAKYPTVMDFFPPELAAPLHPVGRLDKDAEGLLLFTDDGRLDNYILRPEHKREKEYLSLSFGCLTDRDAEIMSAGVVLSGSGFRTGPAEVSILAHTTIGACEAYLPLGREEHFMKNPNRPVTAVRLRISEGHRHQVKLMVKAVGGHVFYLRRTAIGSLRLDTGLAPGGFRPLTEEELDILGYPAE